MHMRPAGAGAQRRPLWQAALSVLAILAVAAGGGYLLFGRGGTASGHPLSARSREAAHRPLAASAHSGHALATFSITWVGDMTFGSPGQWPPDGPGSLISGVASHLHSDLTIGNLETAVGTLPLAKCAPGESDCYAFEAPPDTPRALRQAGFSAVNVANNHTLDAGEPGVASTDAALRSAHLVWDGRPGQITYLTRHGIRIALLGFAPWSYDANMLDIPAAAALVRQARKHAAVVIVMIHAGAEGPDAQHVRPGEEYGGRRRGLARHGLRAARPAGHAVVPGPPDRLQPRQLLRLQHPRPERGHRRQRHPARDAAGERIVRSGEHHADRAVRARHPRGRPGPDRGGPDQLALSG
jgi:hypothetical protein